MPVSSHLTWHLLSSQSFTMPQWMQSPAPSGRFAYFIALDDANFVPQPNTRSVWQVFRQQWLSDLAHTKHNHGLIW